MKNKEYTIRIKLRSGQTKQRKKITVCEVFQRKLSKDSVSKHLSKYEQLALQKALITLGSDIGKTVCEWSQTTCYNSDKSGVHKDWLLYSLINGGILPKRFRKNLDALK